MSFSLLLPLVQLLLPLQPFTLCCSLLLLLHRTSCVRAWAKFILSSSIAGSFSCMWVVLLLLCGASSSCSWLLFLLLRGFSFEVSHLLSFLIWCVVVWMMAFENVCCCCLLLFVIAFLFFFIAFFVLLVVVVLCENGSYRLSIHMTHTNWQFVCYVFLKNSSN